MSKTDTDRAWRERNRERKRANDKAYREANGERLRQQMREWRRANGATRWIRHLASRYNLTREEYDSMVEDQGGVCRICQQPTPGKRLHVDHNHETGVVRALLCTRCNTGLGMFRENPALMRIAASYIEEFSNE